MGLETFGFINDLVITNPIGASDTKSQGDDHLRGIKSTLKTTFPNATAAFYFPSTATKTGAYSVVAGDQNKILLCNATAGAFTVTLGAAVTLGSRFRITVIKTDSSVNAVTIDGNAAETIDGATTKVLSRQYEGTTIVCDASAWFSEGLSLASAVGPGIVELATTTESLTGTDAARAVTPDALAALWEKGSNVASAGTISLGEGRFFHITGTTTITDIDFAPAKDGRTAWLEFDGALTITYHATTLVTPGAANIITEAGDRALVIQDSSDNVHVLDFVRAARLPITNVVRQIFTANGTYTPSAGMKYCIVEAVGGGGGGGGAAASSAGTFNGAGGGGGGEYARELLSATSIGASKAVTIGAAGTGGAAGANNGVAGGDTNLGTTLVVAIGGGGGIGVADGASGNGGIGGTGGTGTVLVPGERGGSGSRATIITVLMGERGGSGGHSVLGFGGHGSPTSQGGFGYGAGGGGGGSFNAAAAQAGGPGSAGVLIVTEFVH